MDEYARSIWIQFRAYTRGLAYLLVIFGVTAQLAIADEIPAIRPTKAAGAGANRDEALRDALRSAVEAGVGLYLDTASEVKNADLISDKILTHSQGYVESYQIVKETAGSIYRIEIVAQVKSLLIKQSLQNEKLLPFEGTNVYANAVTNLDRQSSAKQLVAETLADYPNGSFVFNMAKPSVRTKEGKAFLDIAEASATFQDGQLKRLLLALDQVALTKERAVKDGRVLWGPEKFICPEAYKDEFGNYIFASIDGIYYCFKVDAEVYDEIKTVQTRSGMSYGYKSNGNEYGATGEYGGHGIVSVVLKDSQGVTIYEKIVNADLHAEQLEAPRKSIPSMIPIFQKIEIAGSFSEAMSQRRATGPGGRVSLTVEVDVDRINQAKAIEIRFLDCLPSRNCVRVVREKSPPFSPMYERISDQGARPLQSSVRNDAASAPSRGQVSGSARISDQAARPMLSAGRNDSPSAPPRGQMSGSQLTELFSKGVRVQSYLIDRGIRENLEFFPDGRMTLETPNGTLYQGRWNVSGDILCYTPTGVKSPEAASFRSWEGVEVCNHRFERIDDQHILYQAGNQRRKLTIMP